MTAAALAVCVAFAATAGGCATAPAERVGATGATGDGRGVIVTEDDPSLPRGCGPAAIAGLLERPAAGHPLRLWAVIVGLANGLGQIQFRAAGGLVGKGTALACVRHWS